MRVDLHYVTFYDSECIKILVNRSKLFKNLVSNKNLDVLEKSLRKFLLSTYPEEPTVHTKKKNICVHFLYTIPMTPRWVGGVMVSANIWWPEFNSQYWPFPQMLNLRQVKIQQSSLQNTIADSVSYTHLTLPTILLV